MTPEVQKEVERLASEYDIPVEEFADRVNWYRVSKYQQLSEYFIREFADRVNWTGISIHQKLSEPFIREFSDRVNWFYISGCQKLSESFIRECSDRVDWYEISIHQKLSESFIREFADRVNWTGISAYHQLSESFIREFADRVDWSIISAYQQLSEPFIREFADRVSWYWISRYQALSEPFIQEFQDTLYVKVQRKKHHQVINKEAAIQKYAKKHDLEYKDGVLVAYRNHDSWGRGAFNRATFYEPGQYYQDWHCDLDSESDNSFGLGIWPKGNTKVLVKVEDWGVAVNRKDGKARVWGFEVANI